MPMLIRVFEVYRLITEQKAQTTFGETENLVSWNWMVWLTDFHKVLVSPWLILNSSMALKRQEKVRLSYEKKTKQIETQWLGEDKITQGFQSTRLIRHYFCCRKANVKGTKNGSLSHSQHPGMPLPDPWPSTSSGWRRSRLGQNAAELLEVPSIRSIWICWQRVGSMINSLIFRSNFPKFGPWFGYFDGPFTIHPLGACRLARRWCTRHLYLRDACYI